MPADAQPQSLAIRAYKVGFGDCTLLTFRYTGKNRHVLIDCGSTGSDDGSISRTLKRVAEDISERCGGKLHAVVATHRHKDHIGGFTTSRSKNSSGDLIANLKPDVVIQPWTEDPKAQPDAVRPTGVSSGARAFTAALASMQSLAAAALKETQRRPSAFGRNMLKQLRFLGEDNIANRSAVVNLMKMSRRRFYVHFGSVSGLEDVLPGVQVRVLGPPTLEQSGEIRKHRSEDEQEYWHLQALAHGHAGKAADILFPGAKTYAERSLPPHTRWFVERMKSVRGDQLLEIVRALDTAMNNTSVILLFEAGSKKLLFSGDAQIENWSYALNRPEMAELLAGVDVYKVGHHGSLNATPKSLWKLFEKRSRSAAQDRLITILSTMAGKHGDARRGTEVPRKKLVDALRSESNMFSTQTITSRTKPWLDFEIEL